MYKGDIPFHILNGKEIPLTYAQKQFTPLGSYAASQPLGSQYNPIWKPNYSFTDVLKVDGYSRGRSAANINVTSQTTGISYSFFMSDFLDVVEECQIEKGMIEKKEWCFVKKGSNFGLCLYKG